MSESDRCSTNGTGDNEVDSGTQNDGNHSADEADQDNEADQSGGRGDMQVDGYGESGNSPGEGPSGGATDVDSITNSSGILNTNYDSNDGSIPVYKCDQCEYETFSQATLQTHSRCHDSRKMFECDVCNMKFSNGANMRRHKMRHTGVKPYECKVCQKRFFRKDHLMEHFTTHTKTLPYHCPICNKGFQRQIAMRAHFQNEHVGQNDMIKSCPLCSYRAGSMKSLRVHFFNRHGIDLDNPSTGVSSPVNTQSKEVSALARSLGYDSIGDSSVPGSRPASAEPSMHLVPPHFLTPHVEISMASSGAYSQDSSLYNFTVDSSLVSRPTSDGEQGGSPRPNGALDCPSISPSGSPQSDSNSNTPSSSHDKGREDDITPSISLIPIKQEPSEDSNPYNGEGGGEGKSSSTFQEGITSGSANSQHGSDIQVHSDSPVESQNHSVPETSKASSSSVSLIKVSPLKSLLRDDAKRTHMRNRPIASRPTSFMESQANGTITSTEQEPSRVLSPHKRILQCIYCGIIFPDQTLYFLHKGCHSESNPWKCNICGEQCSNLYDFNSHLLSKTHQ